ncbi:MAG: hypothetical protein QNJ63_25885 [Calothrix sp. MO_192.B10]|nr:hypothetical protein [Calothrix sp. MO_192.B10]
MLIVSSKVEKTAIFVRLVHYTSDRTLYHKLRIVLEDRQKLCKIMFGNKELARYRWGIY